MFSAILLNLFWITIFIAAIGGIISVIFKKAIPLVLAIPFAAIVIIKTFTFIIDKMVVPAISTGLDLTLNGFVLIYENAKFLGLLTIALFVIILISRIAFTYLHSKN